MIDLTHVLRGATLGLAWFLLINVLASSAIAAVPPRILSGHASRAPAWWFGLRMFPSTVAAFFVAAIFVPSYVKYEPREYGEGFDISLALLAVAAAAVVASGVWRGARAWWRASRRVRAWMRSADAVTLAGAGMQAYVVNVDAPLMALAGILRPRVIVSRRLIEALTPDELAASVAHESGHQRARDNVKRLAMRAAPDVLSATAVARTLERGWASASEHSADRLAVRDSTDARCALASALVKVARLASSAPTLGEPISTFAGGGEIAWRVERLLDDDPHVRAAPPVGPRWIAAGVALSAAWLSYAPLLRAVHEATEVLVRTLP